MLPYILKICGFRNSIVYTFYGMYEKYTFFIKLCIYGLTYRLYVRLKHKLRIDVITYIPTLANGPLNIRTSAGYLFWYILLRRYGLLRFGGGGSPVDLWDGIPAAISNRGVTAALGRPQQFHRKVPRPIPGIRKWWLWPSEGAYNF